MISTVSRALQFILGHTAVVNGQPIAKAYDDARLSLAYQRSAMEMYGYDGLVLHGWANAGGAEFGGEIEYPVPQVHRGPDDEEEPGAERGRRLEPECAGRHHSCRHHPRLRSSSHARNSRPA